MFRKALKEDYKVIYNIYLEAFKCEEEASLFFELENIIDYCYVLENNNKIISIGFRFIKDIDNQKLSYLYALATIKEEMNKGYMSLMLSEFEKLDNIERLDGSFLIPASSYLQNFYKKNGFTFENKIGKNICDFKFADSNVRVLDEKYAYDCLNIYNVSFKDEKHIKRDINSYIYNINLYNNIYGHVYGYFLNNKLTTYLFYENSEIKEVFGVNYLELVAHINSLHNLKSVIYYTNGLNKINSLVKFYNSEFNFYANLLGN